MTIYSKYSTSTNLHDTVASSATDGECVCRWPGRERESGGDVGPPVFPLRRRQQTDTCSYLVERDVGATPTGFARANIAADIWEGMGT